MFHFSFIASGSNNLSYLAMPTSRETMPQSNASKPREKEKTK
jgi:hypothetical protein